MARYRSYKPKELEQMLLALQSGIPLEELRLVNRTTYGIASKMIQLSKENPDIWNPEKIREYTRKEIKKHKRDVRGKRYKGDVRGQKRRYHMKHRSEREIWREQVRDRIDWEEFKGYLENFSENYKSKREFAREMGIDPSTLSRFLSGKRTPSYKFFRKLAEKANVPYEIFEKSFL